MTTALNFERAYARLQSLQSLPRMRLVAKMWREATPANFHALLPIRGLPTTWLQITAEAVFDVYELTDAFVVHFALHHDDKAFEAESLLGKVMQVAKLVVSKEAVRASSDEPGHSCVVAEDDLPKDEVRRVVARTALAQVPVAREWLRTSKLLKPVFGKRTRRGGKKTRKDKGVSASPPEVAGCDDDHDAGSSPYEAAGRRAESPSPPAPDEDHDVGPPPVPPLPPVPPPPAEAATGSRRSGEDDECVVCLDDMRTMACIPCGHRCACEACAGVLDRARGCPVCRVPIEGFLRVYV